MKVLIIGAGCSGLAAIKCCVEEGLEPICFERTSEAGGLWNYREDLASPELGCVFKSTVINTSKETMCYSDFPCPKEYPNFMHNTMVNKYLHLYAEKFDLLKHVTFRTSVTSLKKADDYDTTGKWKAIIKDEKTGDTRGDIFDAVMVCTGHHAKPHKPTFPGMEDFSGQVMHTHYYRKPFGFENKRIVVVGIGNSGADTAVELGRFASKLFLSTRRGTWLLRRLGPQGFPNDLWRTRFTSAFPEWLRNHFLEAFCESAFDHAKFGLKPAHRVLAAHPTISDELPVRITSGAVTVKPNIERFTETGIKFEDGTVEDNIELVVLATGYDIAFPFIHEPFAKVEGNKTFLYKHVFFPDLAHQTIAMIGVLQPWGAAMPVVDLQCRWVTRVFNGKTKLPAKSDMWRSIKDREARMAKRCVKTQRHTVQEDYVSYMDEIAVEFGAKPNFLRMFFFDPIFWYKNIFGVFLPYQYRLEGPGAWEEARELIDTVWDRVEKPLQTRKAVQNSGGVNKWLVLLGLLGIAMAARRATRASGVTWSYIMGKSWSEIGITSKLGKFIYQFT